MPSGHTKTETINDRKPLTPRMRDMLRNIAFTEVFWGNLGTANKNVARALMDRRLVGINDENGLLHVTAAGMEAGR